MSATEAQPPCGISARIRRQAWVRYARWRTGSVAFSSAETASRTVSWITSPSGVSSTNGRLVELARTVAAPAASA